MIKDLHFKRLFIPVLGSIFPFLAGLVWFHSHTAVQLLLAICFFTVLVFFIWQGEVKLTSYLRSVRPLNGRLFQKLAVLLTIAGLYAAFLGFAFSFIWQRFLFQEGEMSPVLNATMISGITGAFLALIYEVVFLSVDSELDKKVLQQIDKERLEAEMNVLKNELDPHFFFNCMNTLSYLVKHDQDKAYHFVHKLSNIYKYFLRNKEVDFVSLQNEIEFLEDYYYLLQIRFEDNIRIENSIDGQSAHQYILPCTLQVLVENAIKHNFFSEKEPLVISIAMNGSFITVSNPVKPKQHASESTKVGLRNLKARYRLITNQNILVQKANNKFSVKLPLVKPTSQHDKSSDH